VLDVRLAQSLGISHRERLALLEALHNQGFARAAIGEPIESKAIVLRHAAPARSTDESARSGHNPGCSRDTGDIAARPPLRHVFAPHKGIGPDYILLGETLKLHVIHGPKLVVSIAIVPIHIFRVARLGGELVS